MQQNELNALALKARGGDAQARAALAEMFPPKASLSIRAESFDAEASTVEGLLSTDAPVEMFDWERWERMTEYLAPSGMRSPAQIPVLDTHSRQSIEDVVGSATNIRAEGGGVLGTIKFAGTDRGRQAAQLVQEGHLTDLSVGYRVTERTLIEAGEKLTVGGRSYSGPGYVVTGWDLREVSVCPIGADEGAKLRSLISNATPGLSLGNPTEEGRHMELPTEKDKGIVSADPKPEGGERASNVVLTEEVDAICQLAGDVVTDKERAELVVKATRGEVKLDALKADLIARRAKLKDDTNTARVIQVGDNNDVRSFQDAFADALLLRSGKVKENGKVTAARGEASKTTEVKLHERARELSRLSTLDLLRIHLDQNGIRTSGKNADDLLKLAGRGNRATFTTGDFSVLLENTMNKVLLLGFQTAPSTWRRISRVISANDMRQHNLYKKGGFSSLARVGETGEIPLANMPDGKKEVITPKNFARLFQITDEAIINDDLQALTEVPMEMGMAAEYTINELVWYTILANPTMNEDSVAFFHADHNNLTTGAASPPSKTTFDTMFGKAGLQTNLAGKPIAGALPTWAAVPPQLRSTLFQLLNSEFVPGANNNERNIYAGQLDPIIEPLLYHGVTIATEGADLTAAGSATAYYLGADPSVLPAVAVAFYGGETPRIRQDRPVGVLGTQYEVLLRTEAAAYEWRGTQKHTGA